MTGLTDIWKHSAAKKILISVFVGILILLLIPVCFNLIISFQRRHSFLMNAKFIGIDNYRELLASSEFWKSFWNGTFYAIVSVSLQMIIGVYSALYIHARTKSKNLLLGAIIFPYLIPTVIAAILWKWLLNSSYGVLNHFLFKSDTAWFDSGTIMGTVIFVSVWQFFPFITIFTIARLKIIPIKLYQLAASDGATPFQQFLHVTMPALKGTLLMLLFIRFIWMFTKFDTVWLLGGQGGSLESIQNLPVLSYRLTFRYLQAGMGAAVAMIMLLFIGMGSVVYYRKLLKHSYE